MKKIYTLTVLSFFIFHFQTKSQNWESLFNGKDLKGWEQVGGKAKYYIEDDAIVGEAVLNTENSFLTTEKMYGDFILELEVYASSRLNSGIQIRSNTFKEYKNGRFHGYQVEIDPGTKGYSGGIYDEARRGWLYPMSLNDKARNSLVLNEWNTFHIEAIGNEINTWINGVHCAKLVDDMTSEGRIGLQVHSVSNTSGLEGATIKWKNIRILTDSPKDFIRLKDSNTREISFLNNQLSEWEKRNGFRLLWDGKTTNGWNGAKLDKFPENSWEIKDGVLTLLANDEQETTSSDDIVTKELYGDFELKLEYMIEEGANTGIVYYANPLMNKNSTSVDGCEFQIIDNKTHPEAKEGVNGNRKSGSLYDLIPPQNLSLEDRKTPGSAIGKWNRVRIISKDGKVEHWLNYTKVVEYNRFSQTFSALVTHSKFKNQENFGRWEAGYILLKDNGSKVSFKNIKIRELN